jgi:hypothetical protein
VRIAEVDVQVGRGGDGGVVGHLAALIPGQGSAQDRWQYSHFRHDRVRIKLTNNLRVGL